MQNSKSIVLRTENIKKSFGEIKALTGISMELYSGEVVGLVGDNGAGKSTFVNIVSGALSPDEGQIFFCNREVKFNSPRQAREAGIETIYQDLALAPDITVYENIFMGYEPTKFSFLGPLQIVDKKKMINRSKELINNLGLDFEPTRLTDELSGGQRQSLAVARAKLRGVKLILMDEPTAALGAHQTQMVHSLIRQISEQGTTILVISHNFPEIIKLADRIIVFRQGKIVANVSTDKLNQELLLGLVTGAIESGSDI